MALLRDFSPFAFGSPELEQQYQSYQSAHMGTHVGNMSWSLGASVAVIIILAWKLSMDYPRVWWFNLPVCWGIGLFSTYAPVMFREHWQMFSLIIRTVLTLMDNAVHTFVLTQHVVRGKLHAWTLLELEFYRLLAFMFFAFAFPLSLPAWAVGQVPLYLTRGYILAGKYQNFQNLECPPIPWPVSAFFHSIVSAFLGPGANVSKVARCQVGIVFWKVQAEMLAAVVHLLREVAWRRSFLRAHPHLTGQNDTTRPAAWPFGSPGAVGICISVLAWIISLDVMAVDFWVSGIVGSDDMTLGR
jgi:hypothetical protein